MRTERGWQPWNSGVKAALENCLMVLRAGGEKAPVLSKMKGMKVALFSVVRAAYLSVFWRIRCWAAPNGF
jgi:hypothetical protein